MQTGMWQYVSLVATVHTRQGTEIQPTCLRVDPRKHWEASSISSGFVLGSESLPFGFTSEICGMGPEHVLGGPETEVQIPNPQAGDLGQLTVSPSYGHQCKMGILYPWPGIPVRINRYLLDIPPGDRVNTQHMEVREGQGRYR